LAVLVGVAIHPAATAVQVVLQLSDHPPVTAAAAAAALAPTTANAWLDGGAARYGYCGSPLISIAGGKEIPAMSMGPSGGINYLATGGSSPLGLGGNGGAQNISAVALGRLVMVPAAAAESNPGVRVVALAREASSLSNGCNSR